MLRLNDTAFTAVIETACVDTPTEDVDPIAMHLFLANQTLCRDE